jgi:hypothetical protein
LIICPVFDGEVYDLLSKQEQYSKIAMVIDIAHGEF